MDIKYGLLKKVWLHLTILKRNAQ